MRKKGNKYLNAVPSYADKWDKPKAHPAIGEG